MITAPRGTACALQTEREDDPDAHGFESQSNVQAGPRLGCTSTPGKTTTSATASTPGRVKSRTPPVTLALVVLLVSRTLSLVTRKLPATRARPTEANGVTVPTPSFSRYPADRSPPNSRFSRFSRVSRVSGSVTEVFDLATSTCPRIPAASGR